MRSEKSTFEMHPLYDDQKFDECYFLALDGALTGPVKVLGMDIIADDLAKRSLKV